MIRINSLDWTGSFLDAIPSSRYSRNQKVNSQKKTNHWNHFARALPREGRRTILRLANGQWTVCNAHPSILRGQ